MLMFTLWIPNALATDKSGNPMWELIFLSPYGGCTNYQYQMTNAYDEITSKYFELYKFANSKHSSQCMPDKKYTNYKPPEDLDLLILVYDNEIGKKDLHLNDVGGLYSHVGMDRTKNHVIVICDCSNFGFSDPAWTLSHELSHFITYYLGYDLSVQNTIHMMSSKYNECIEGHRDASCSNVVVNIRGDYYFTHAAVMTPYQPAIGKNLIVLNGTRDSSNVTDSQIVLNMQKEITKWWLAGKINDTEYLHTLGYMINNKPEVKSSYLLPANILLESGPDSHEENSTYYDLDLSQNQKTMVLLKRSPFRDDNTTDISNKMQIPEWFKSQASRWIQNNSWDDKDFIGSIKHLFWKEMNYNK